MATKKHPAEESFDRPPKGGFLSNADSVPEVQADKPISTGTELPVEPNDGSARIPCSKEPPAPRGVQLPGSHTDRTGAGHDLPPAPHDPVDGF